MGKRKRKKQSKRPEDYFNNGEFEIARFGERISMKNIRTAEARKNLKNAIANNTNYFNRNENETRSIDC